MSDRIDQLMREAAANPRVIGLGGGLPAEAQFPQEALTAAFVRALRRQGSPALQYGWPEGLDTLRARVAARLAQRGANVGADEVIITNGAQQAIAIATQLVLRAEDRVGVDAATYPSALELFRARGLLPGPHDGAQALYLMPAVSNPGGASLGAAERADLLARGVPIIEDDAYADLHFAGAAPAPLLAASRARTLHVGTFSKTLCPGLRVGWLVTPPRLRRRALRIKRDDDLQANSLSQSVVDDFLAHQDFDARLIRLRRFYRNRAHRLAEAVRRALPSWHFRFPEGGFGLWLECDGAADEVRFLELAIEEGVSFDPGLTFRAAPAADAAALRLCFSLAPPAQFAEAAARLARAWRRVQRAGRTPRLGVSSRLDAGAPPSHGEEVIDASTDGRDRRPHTRGSGARGVWLRRHYAARHRL